MPKQVTAFICRWGCKKQVTINSEAMKQHELTCGYNPARKSCKTCNHNYRHFDRWHCQKKHLPHGKVTAYDCQFWEEKSQ